MIFYIFKIPNTLGISYIIEIWFKIKSKFNLKKLIKSWLIRFNLVNHDKSIVIYIIKLKQLTLVFYQN